MAEDSNKPVYTISTAAKLMGISVHTLRMYENEGLIIPFKKESNQRLYSDEDVERVRCIRKSIQDDKIGIAGLKSIASLIPCWEIVKCSSEDRENCESFISHLKPCWTYKHNNNLCSNLACINCPVYKEFNCSNVRQKIFEVISSKTAG